MKEKSKTCGYALAALFSVSAIDVRLLSGFWLECKSALNECRVKDVNVGGRREKRHSEKFFLCLFTLQGTGHYLLFYTKCVRHDCLRGLIYHGFLQNAYRLPASAFRLYSIQDNSQWRHYVNTSNWSMEIIEWHKSETVKAPEFSVL